MSERIVVVGAGQAGQALTTKLRGEGFTGDIVLIGAEDVPPYQRPPLSKKYLLGEMPKDRLFLRPESYYAEHGIELRLGREVTAIDRAAKTVAIGEEQVGYDQLALTTGSAPRRLPAGVGGDLAGVHVVRTIADVDGMSAEFVPGRHALIVGGGYIGLEAAAVAAKLGLAVTLIELSDRILCRVAAPETATFFRRLHEDHGVRVREGVALEALLGENRVKGAQLSDGTTLDIDFAVIGVGIDPRMSLAEAAGLDTGNGIRVDDRGRTSDPAIWAAGDCTAFPFRGGRVRLESVQNAIDQAETVARNMLGADEPYVPVPWFWSDQYDIKLQIAGLNTGYDRLVVRTGDADHGRSVWYFCGDDLRAVDAMNDTRAYMVGKRLIEAGRSPDPQVLADPATDLKSLLKG